MLFLMVCLCIRSQLVLSKKDVEILVSLPYGWGVASDVVVNGPAFELASQNVKTTYGNNISIRYFTNPSQRTCDDIGSQNIQMIADYYYANSGKEKCYALVTTPCNDMTGITSLAQGLNWLLFNPVLSTNKFLNPSDGSPSTAIAIGGTLSGYCKVVLDIMDYYKWHHATVLVEMKTVITFYKDLGNSLVDAAKAAPQPYELDSYALKDDANETLRTGLRVAQKRSRVIILLTSGRIVARILRMSNETKMTNGEYVFINVQLLQGDAYGKISQFAYSENDTVLNAFRSLIFIAYRPPGAELKALNLAIAEYTKLKYNYSYQSGAQPLDSFVVRAAYDTVEVMAAVLRESEDDRIPSSKSDCSGVELAGRLANRTFALSTGTVFINAGRARNLNVDIFGFNMSMMGMQVLGGYDWKANGLVWADHRSFDWPTADGEPPLDVPVCGFSGIEGICAQQYRLAITTAIAAGCVVGFLLPLLVALARWYSWKLRGSAEKWWELMPHQIAAVVFVSRNSVLEKLLDTRKPGFQIIDTSTTR